MSALLTPTELKRAMAQLQVDPDGLATLLRLGKNGRVTVYRWLRGATPIRGPESVAIEALLTGWRPGEGAE